MPPDVVRRWSASSVYPKEDSMSTRDKGGTGPQSDKCWICDSHKVAYPYEGEHAENRVVRLCPQCDPVPRGRVAVP